MNRHGIGTWYLAPSDDPADEYSAGFDGNTFGSREEAEAEIPHLVASFAQWADAEDVAASQWVAVQRGGQS